MRRRGAQFGGEVPGPDADLRIPMTVDRRRRAVVHALSGRSVPHSQVAAYGRTLDQAAQPDVTALWQLMKGLRSAVTQERMIRADAP